jgi:hypothetical protein
MESAGRVRVGLCPFAVMSKQTMEQNHGRDEPAGSDSGANGQPKADPPVTGSPPEQVQVPRPPGRSSRRPSFNVPVCRDHRRRSGYHGGRQSRGPRGGRLLDRLQHRASLRAALQSLPRSVDQFPLLLRDALVECYRTRCWTTWKRSYGVKMDADPPGAPATAPDRTKADAQ